MFVLVPLFGHSVFGGGAFGPAQTFHTLDTDTEFIIQEDNASENSVYMQHILINGSGLMIDVTVSSYQSADFLKVDEVCKTQKLFTNHILVIPYSTINTSELGRYLMLPALAEFVNPDETESNEIMFDKQSLVLGDGSSGGFTQSVDFSCDDIYVIMNPRYEHAFDDSLGMDTTFSQPTVERNGQQSSQQSSQQSPQQNGQQSDTNLTPQEQEILRQADELLQQYQNAAQLQNAPLNPTERPFLVEQNTEQFRDQIVEQMQLQEQLIQQLQQNPNFQNFDEQLSNEGLIQQPPLFDMSEEESRISVPYQNDETSAAISAEFQNGQITNVFLERPSDEIESNLLWIIPLVIGIVAVSVLASKRRPKKKSIKIPIVVKNDNYTISYIDLTREMLHEAQNMYNEELFKDAHEKLSQAIRFYYSNRLSNGIEITNMDTLQLLRKEKIPEFDSILNYLGMCEMIEFAKNPTEKKKFFSAIENFSEIIE
tara:strand:+ start:3660 stop:5108 length:1449 start_codon:yes stop_codon:yes gene_type:complete